MKNNTIQFIPALLFAALAFSCQPVINDDKPSKEKITEKEIVAEHFHVPVFSEDSAFYFIEKQVDFGPRVPNTKAHTLTAEFLSNKLRSYNFNVIVQEAKLQAFDNTILNMKNIIAEHNPDNPNRIMLFAHWDTRPFADQDSKDRNKPIDGANDGASGVGVLLEIARQINLYPPDIGIDIIFFDAEDYGQPDGTMIARKPDTYALGSQYWSRNKHKTNYAPRYGILLDMVGAKDAIFTKEGTSMYYAPMVVKKVWDAAARLGYSDYFVDKRTPGIIDDHTYVNSIAGIPSIDIIQYDSDTPSGFGEYWHTHRDNIDIIDKNTLKAVGQTLLEVIYREK
jgi:Zn-dependent M28 family amino/carboxypeptidase